MERQKNSQIKKSGLGKKRKQAVYKRPSCVQSGSTITTALGAAQPFVVLTTAPSSHCSNLEQPSNGTEKTLSIDNNSDILYSSAKDQINVVIMALQNVAKNAEAQCLLSISVHIVEKERQIHQLTVSGCVEPSTQHLGGRTIQVAGDLTTEVPKIDKYLWELSLLNPQITFQFDIWCTYDNAMRHFSFVHPRMESCNFDFRQPTPSTSQETAFELRKKRLKEFFVPDELVGIQKKNVDCYLLFNCRGSVLTFNPHTNTVTPYFILLAFQNSIPTTDFMSTLLSYLREVDWVRHSSCSFALSCEQEPTVINDEDFVIPKLGSHFHLQNIFSERFPQTDRYVAGVKNIYIIFDFQLAESKSGRSSSTILKSAKKALIEAFRELKSIHFVLFAPSCEFKKFEENEVAIREIASAITDSEYRGD
jgi:hypothetical protein